MNRQRAASEGAYARFFHERYQQLREKFSNLLNVLAGPNKTDKINAVKIALEAATDLSKALAQEDQPPWLAPLISSMQQFLANNGEGNSGRILLNAIQSHGSALHNHVWEFAVENSSPFDFDGLYRQYEDESRIPELFQKIVDLLEKILESGEIDSRKVVQSLETIIATIKRNLHGSYFGVMGTWRFTGAYLKKVAWNALNEIPGLRVFTKSLRETLVEMDAEMAKTNQLLQSDLSRRLDAEFPELSYQPAALPERLALPDNSVVDGEFEVINEPIADKEPPLSAPAPSST